MWSKFEYRVNKINYKVNKQLYGVNKTHHRANKQKQLILFWHKLAFVYLENLICFENRFFDDFVHAVCTVVVSLKQRGNETLFNINCFVAYREEIIFSVYVIVSAFTNFKNSISDFFIFIK